MLTCPLFLKLLPNPQQLRPHHASCMQAWTFVPDPLAPLRRLCSAVKAG